MTVRNLCEIKSTCATDNGGVPKYGKEVERYISVVPSERQLGFEKLEYYNFIHFGINTMNNAEWGNGKEDISRFNPKKLDTDNWCKILKETGSKGIIITAKHHDGFCLWNTKYTDHSVMYTPFGRDIVAMLRKSCDKFGLKLGIYLSPWDRHESTYGTDEYNDYFVSQLTELATQYGEIFTFWFDGACGEGPNGKKQVYDFERYYKVIREKQPNALIAICGPDVRWIGNEGGRVRESEWSVIPGSTVSVESVMEGSQQSEDGAQALAEIVNTDDDQGSRKVISKYRDLIWSPAEADVSVTTGWFYHNNWYYLFKKKRTAKQLADIYFNAVGGNASMLLNVPPNKDGLIDKREVKTLKEFTRLITEPFENEITHFDVYTVSKEADKLCGTKPIHFENDDFALKLKLKDEKEVSTLVISEDIRFSQRTERFEVWVRKNGEYELINKSTVIGSKKIIRLEKAVKTQEIVFVFKQTRSNPVIKGVQLYE